MYLRTGDAFGFLGHPKRLTFIKDMHIVINKIMDAMNITFIQAIMDTTETIVIKVMYITNIIG
jgi:hypothetical protein